MPAPLDPPNQTQPPTPSRDDPREAWEAWARAEFPSAADAAAEAALNVIDAGGEASVAVAAAHRVALLRSVSGSPPPPGPVVSPDGRHWWDGAAWREVQVTPATATAHDIPPPPGQLPLFGPPVPWTPPPPPWAAPPAPPAQPHTGRLVGAALGAVAVLAAVAVVAISLVVHRSSDGGSTSGGGTVTFAPGSTHCTFRVSAESFSLIIDSSDAPVDCGAVEAGFQAAERSVGATVTPIVGLPSGATSACSHQFGSSGYTVTIYRDPSGGGGTDADAFIQAACGAFLHVVGGG